MNKKILVVLFLILIPSYLFINYTIDSDPNKNIKEHDNFGFIKNLIPLELKIKIKDIIFPYKSLKQEKNRYSDLVKQWEKYKILSLKGILNNDLMVKNNLLDLKFVKTSTNILSNDMMMEIYSPVGNQILRGTQNESPGSVYLEFYKDNLFIVSNIGIIAYADVNKNDLNFKQIKNNFLEYLDFPSIYTFDNIIENQSKRVGIKDVKIYQDEIFISFTNNKKGCWNINLIRSNLDFENLQLKKIFDPKECVNENDKDFELRGNNINFSQTGGRIQNFKDGKIIFSTGEFRLRKKAQDPNSIFGKILSLDLNSNEIEMLSLGHRNPQGLFYDENDNFIISSEHGPKGGDEINIIDLKSQNTKNFGWPISSYGEHYGGGKSGIFRELYEKYPLFKTHKDKGFIEPIKYFTPSVAPSEIIKIGDKKYLLATMKDKSLYEIILDKENEINKLTRIEVGERIRDMIINNNIIYLYLEDTGSIAKIKLN